MKNMNLSDAQKNALLGMAGKRLGTDPGQLREKLESGSLEDVIQGLDSKDKEKVNSFLQNPKALQALLGNAQVQDLLKNLSGK